MELKIWIFGGLVATALGSVLALFFRMPALAVASVVVCTSAILHAGSAGASVSTQIVFSGYLLVILQAAYLGTAILRSKTRK